MPRESAYGSGVMGSLGVFSTVAVLGFAAHQGWQKWQDRERQHAAALSQRDADVSVAKLQAIHAREQHAAQVETIKSLREELARLRVEAKRPPTQVVIVDPQQAARIAELESQLTAAKNERDDAIDAGIALQKRLGITAIASSEAEAGQRLDLAQSLMRANPEAAKARLRQIVGEFPFTDAAREARRLLGMPVAK